jgi:NAD+ kinase
MNKIRKIAIVVNAQKPGGVTYANTLEKLGNASGLQVTLTNDYPIHPDFLADQDLCFTIGGDGTLLAIVESAARYRIPILGINHGKLGFLATFSEKEIEESFNSLIAGNYTVQERALLECSNALGERTLALNDIVVRSVTSRLVRLEVRADGQVVNDYYADGLIITSPTGSTAYNLSAGGPILHPDAPVIAMTPICPHTLSNRSVIFSDRTTLEIVLQQKTSGISVTKDGRPFLDSANGFPLIIRQSTESLPLIVTQDHDHFDLVRRKLHWGRDRE